MQEVDKSAAVPEPPEISVVPQPLKYTRYPWISKGKRMTIAAGFRVQEGILLCADTQYTGTQIINETKLFPLDCGEVRVVMALAGSEAYGKMVIQECLEAIRQSSMTRTLRAMRLAIRETLKPLYEEYVDTRPTAAERDGAQFCTLTALWSKAEGLDLIASQDTAVWTVPSWNCLGSGEYLARFLLDPVYTPSISSEIAVRLAAQAMAAIKGYDAACGGDTEMILMHSDGSMEAVDQRKIRRAEHRMQEHEREGRKLMLSLANLSQRDDRFDEDLKTFSDRARETRQSWKVHGS